GINLGSAEKLPCRGHRQGMGDIPHRARFNDADTARLDIPQTELQPGKNGRTGRCGVGLGCKYRQLHHVHP
ncbi:MAG TPA: hypothetical protein PKD72_15425, partial [Gemmatales bacterium]|nr:hypothetical protein [Gemmatales bacterium]